MAGLENESRLMPKIITDDTINLFFLTAISILVISNHDSFRVLFDNLHPYVFKIYLYFSIGNGQPREPALCQLYWHSFVLYEFVANLPVSLSPKEL